jgi:SPP1 family predicted phage head-tail adaptor
MILKAGDLREKIVFKRPVRVSNGSGGYTTTYTDILNTFASVSELSSDPTLIASQENIKQVIKVLIRYRADIAVKIADIILWRGFEFVVSNMKADVMRTYIEFQLTATMETSIR